MFFLGLRKGIYMIITNMTNRDMVRYRLKHQNRCTHRIIRWIGNHPTPGRRRTRHLGALDEWGQGILEALDDGSGTARGSYEVTAKHVTVATWTTMLKEGMPLLSWLHISASVVIVIIIETLLTFLFSSLSSTPNLILFSMSCYSSFSCLLIIFMQYCLFVTLLHSVHWPSSLS